MTTATKFGVLESGWAVIGVLESGWAVIELADPRRLDPR